MKDKVYLSCPECAGVFYTTVYKGPNENIAFTLDDAPLIVITEINHESRKGNVQCVHCGLHIAVCVRFMANSRPLSGKYNEGWRRE